MTKKKLKSKSKKSKHKIGNYGQQLCCYIDISVYQIKRNSLIYIIAAQHFRCYIPTDIICTVIDLIITFAHFRK